MSPIIVDAFFLLRSLAPFIAGFGAAFLAYAISSSIDLEFAGGRRSTTRRLERFAGGEPEPTWLDKVGDRMLERTKLDPEVWVLHLKWAHLGGYFRDWSIGGLLGRAVLFALGGVAYAAVMGAPLLWIAPVILFLYPFLRVRSKANETRQRVRKELPEMATLVAAEMTAGNSADQALGRTSELVGPLGTLIHRALSDSRSTGRPLFSRGADVEGVLKESLARMGLTELTAFATQLDLVAGKGVAGPDLMDNIARGLSREYRMRVMRSAEALESELVIPSVLFFFLPFVLAVMIPLIIPLLSVF